MQCDLNLIPEVATTHRGDEKSDILSPEVHATVNVILFSYIRAMIYIAGVIMFKKGKRCVRNLDYSL